MRIIDSHQHLWNLTEIPRSWTARAPTLNRNFLINDYLAEAGALAIEKTVYVETDVDEAFILAEAQAMLAAAEEGSTPLSGVVASGRPEQAEFPRYLDRIGGSPALKGIRRVLHVVSDEVSQSPLFVENVRRLAERHLTFDLCVRARQLPLALALVEKAPDVSFVLDHCGNPPIKSGDREPWATDLARLAAAPNVVCKISGLITNADPKSWTAEQLRPYVETVIALFGWERVMFGSDWPVSTLAGAMTAWISALEEITGGNTAEQRAQLFSENARRVYRLGA